MNNRKMMAAILILFGVIELYSIIYIKCSFISFSAEPYGTCGNASRAFIFVGIALILMGVYVFFKKPSYELYGFEQDADNDLESLKKNYGHFKLQILNYPHKKEIVIMVWITDLHHIEKIKGLFSIYKPIINIDNKCVEYRFLNFVSSEKMLFEIDQEFAAANKKIG